MSQRARVGGLGCTPASTSEWAGRAGVGGRGRKPLKRGSPLRSKPSIDSCMPARISCGQTACGSRDAHAAAAAAGATPADDDDSDTPLGTCCEAQTPPPPPQGSTLVRRVPVTSRDDDTVRQRELATVALRHTTSTGLYYCTCGATCMYMYARTCTCISIRLTCALTNNSFSFNFTMKIKHVKTQC